MSDTPNPTTDDFSFAMGDHQATFRGDRLYATNHMWALPVGENQWRFGLTEYAVRLLQDVYFLDWLVEAGAAIGLRQEIGSIESKKAESDLYSPVAGEMTAINDEALEDPSIINAETYDGGWLFEIRGDGSTLITPSKYAEHLVTAWVVAQRTIKGQANI